MLTKFSTIKNLFIFLSFYINNSLGTNPNVEVYTILSPIKSFSNDYYELKFKDDLNKILRTGFLENDLQKAFKKGKSLEFQYYCEWFKHSYKTKIKPNLDVNNDPVLVQKYFDLIRIPDGSNLFKITNAYEFYDTLINFINLNPNLNIVTREDIKLKNFKNFYLVFHKLFNDVFKTFSTHAAFSKHYKMYKDAMELAFGISNNEHVTFKTLITLICSRIIQISGLFKSDINRKNTSTLSKLLSSSKMICDFQNSLFVLLKHVENCDVQYFSNLYIFPNVQNALDILLGNIFQDDSILFDASFPFLHENNNFVFYELNILTKLSKMLLFISYEAINAASYGDPENYSLPVEEKILDELFDYIVLFFIDNNSIIKKIGNVPDFYKVFYESGISLRNV